MDAIRFDALLSSLSTSPTRRGIARVLAGLTVTGALVPWFGVAGTDAKKKKRKKKKKKKAVTPPPCIPNCAGKACGDNGCGGSCGDCGTCRQCDNGTCKVALDGEPCSSGSCVSGVCEACGRGGMTCCEGGVCFLGECTIAEFCAVCGGEGQVCCFEMGCDDGLQCSLVNATFRCIL
jgi:hypothetical protein